MVFQSRQRRERKSRFDPGFMYAKGHGAKKDDSLAFKWYSKAAQGGDIDAMYSTGLSHMKGRGTKRVEPGGCTQSIALKK